MGETIVVDQNDIRELEDAISIAVADYIRSYADLSAVMHKVAGPGGAIGGPLAQELLAKYTQKEPIFEAIKTELVNAESYMGDKGRALARTMNSISGGLR